jgi:hypothetical protein
MVPRSVLQAAALRGPFAFLLTVDPVVNALTTPAVALVVTVAVSLPDTPPSPGLVPSTAASADSLAAAADPRPSLTIDTPSFYTLRVAVLVWADQDANTTRVACPLITATNANASTVAPGANLALGLPPQGVFTVCARAFSAATGAASAASTGVYVAGPAGPGGLDVVPRGVDAFVRPTDAALTFQRGVVVPTGVRWSLRADSRPAWVTVTPSSGTGPTTVTVVVSPASVAANAEADGGQALQRVATAAATLLFNTSSGSQASLATSVRVLRTPVAVTPLTLKHFLPQGSAAAESIVVSVGGVGVWECGCGGVWGGALSAPWNGGACCFLRGCRV